MSSSNNSIKLTRERKDSFQQTTMEYETES